MLDALELVRAFVEAPGPPGQEEAVRSLFQEHAEALGCLCTVDARGNVLAGAPGVKELPRKPRIVVMAHLDEIALIVTRVEAGGWLLVSSMGGAYPWKWGEGPVSILGAAEPLNGILSFGSIYTAAPGSAAVHAREAPLTWNDARIFTGLSPAALEIRGVRPGTRVVLHPSRRYLTHVGRFVSAPFLDDRADLAAMLLVMEELGRGTDDASDIVFAATAAEEVGGVGALYLLRERPAEIGLALEIGPRVPDAPFALDSQPTVWVSDSYSAMQARDVELVAAAAAEAGFEPHWQALSRGGSDASCAASHGLVARPITLAFGAENSHGHEIMHQDAVPNLAALTLAVLRRLRAKAAPEPMVSIEDTAA